MLHDALLQQSQNIINDFALTISLHEQILAACASNWKHKSKLKLKFVSRDKTKGI